VTGVTATVGGRSSGGGSARPRGPWPGPCHNAAVIVERLSTVDGFVVFDLDGATSSVGVVRLAPKVLVDGATWLARSQTYQLASLGRRAGGASAAVNATADGRAAAIEAFVAEVAPWVASGRLALAPGKGTSAADLAGLPAPEGDRSVPWDRRPELVARGVVASAETALGGPGSLDGRTVAVEALDPVGVAVAHAVLARGGRLAAVGAGSGAAVVPADLDAEVVATALAEHGAGAAEASGWEVGSASTLWGTPADVLVVGSKAGVVDHLVAEGVAAGCVVPSAPIPITARGLAVLTRRGAVVLPDFVTTTGAALAAEPPEGVDADDLGSLGEAVEATAGALVAEVLALGAAEGGGGPFLAACRRAEAFLATWHHELPFGRPLA
jgi:glutamate dehydrogenase/leucine dehydrogenase